MGAAMWGLQTAWWELLVRGAVVYAALLLLIRISGRRTVGQFTPFDLLVVMLLSEAVSNALTGGDESLVAGLVSAGVLVALNMLIAVVTSRSHAAQRIVSGEAVLIGKDGRLFAQVLKEQHVPYADAEQALREADCDLAGMACAFLEVDGRISILKKPELAPGAGA